MADGRYNHPMPFTRGPHPLDPPISESVRRYYLRLYAGGLILSLIGIGVGIVLQRAHYRGQAGLILAIVSGMFGVLFAAGLTSIPSRRR
jgi:hypothetical protein